MSVSDFGLIAESMQVKDLEVVGHGASSTSGSIHATGIISGNHIRYTVPTIPTGTRSLTPAECLGGLITYATNGAATLTFPAAAALVAAIPKCKVGMTIEVLFVNTGNNTVTVAAAAAGTDPVDAGGALVGAAATIATTVHSVYVIRITSVTSGAEAYIAYRSSAA